MPGKLVRKILDEIRENDESDLRLIDQGIVNILDLPDLSKFLIYKFTLLLCL
jgi:hypothetical protein